MRVGAGAQLGAIYDALDAHGLTIAGGCGTTVGRLGARPRRRPRDPRAAPYGLHGGQRARRRGGARRRRAWSTPATTCCGALRGAGGARFGVVTALEIATVRAPVMTAFETFWDDAGGGDRGLAGVGAGRAGRARRQPADHHAAAAGQGVRRLRRTDRRSARAGGRARQAGPGGVRAGQRARRQALPRRARRRRGRRTTATPTCARSSWPSRSPPRRSTRSSRTWTRAASTASSTSRPGAAPTTASPPTPPRSRTATPAACSSTPR